MGNKSIPLGLIPSGTGNAVGHTLSLHKKRLEEAAHRIARGEVFPLDLNRVKFKTSKSSRSAIKYSVMTICWGLVGDIGTAAELNRNNVLAKYGVAAWVGFKSKPEKVTIQLEGGDLDQPLVINKDLMTAFIQNTPHFGEGYYVTPAAKIDDGQMDVCVVERAHRGTLLKMFTQLPKVSHIHSDIAQTYSVEKAVITPALSPASSTSTAKSSPLQAPSPSPSFLAPSLSFPRSLPTSRPRISPNPSMSPFPPDLPRVRVRVRVRGRVRVRARRVKSKDTK